MDIAVRTAREEDLDAAGRITAAVFVGDGHTSADSDYVALLRDARTRAAEAELLVAVDRAAADRPAADRPAGPRDAPAAVLGSVTLALPGSAWADIARPDEGELRMLAVSPAARGRGVGEALVRAAMDRVRAQGLPRMAFSTQQGMHAAHRLYERVGFRRAPERDWSPFPGVDLWVYAADL
ncbi:GNAT family N-acetyltransferase [Streptomyces sp. NPDC092296]|uniref:GNAT family N-acetyltransferase n=1 Tax=Streptomyces sp. NPDC092296 TaxID=3366012 RepID=UPI00381F6361